MDVAAALLHAIREAPEVDLPRLAYADWLDDVGRPERAEFIRVQVELARTGEGDPRYLAGESIRGGASPPTLSRGRGVAGAMP